MDSSDYDSDFVKDENSDGGKCDAQMNYDILRQKVTAADKELARLKRIMQKEAAEMQEAYDKWQEALDRVNAAKAVTEAAKKAEAAANSKVDGIQDKVTKAASNVEKEME